MVFFPSKTSRQELMYEKNHWKLRPKQSKMSLTEYANLSRAQLLSLINTRPHLKLSGAFPPPSDSHHSNASFFTDPMQQITLVDLGFNNLTLLEPELASALLSVHCQVQTLYLSGNHLADAGVQMFADTLSLQPMAKLRTLYFGLNGVKHISGLFESLHKATKLESIMLGQNHIQDLSAVACHFRSGEIRLKRLELDNNQLCAEAVQELLLALAEAPNTLTHLNLAQNPLVFSSMTVFNYLFKSSHCHLTHLNVSFCQLTLHQFALLCQALRYSTTLTHLDVEQSNLAKEQDKIMVAKCMACVLMSQQSRLVKVTGVDLSLVLLDFFNIKRPKRDDYQILHFFVCLREYIGGDEGRKQGLLSLLFRKQNKLLNNGGRKLREVYLKSFRSRENNLQKKRKRDDDHMDVHPRIQFFPQIQKRVDEIVQEEEKENCNSLKLLLFLQQLDDIVCHLVGESIEHLDNQLLLYSSKARTIILPIIDFVLG